jgi:pyruvate kinase
MALRANDMIAELSALRSAVSTEGRAAFSAFRGRIERREFAVSALNFSHYLALRRRDLRPIQRQLMMHGLSSLGRAESRVLANIDAVVTALAALQGQSAGQLRPPSARQFFRGEARLAIETERLFGARPDGRFGRIMVTLGSDAADDPVLIRQLAEHHADVVRINCAHDDVRAWGRMIAHVRAAETTTGRRLRILMDLAGPKIRTVAVVTPPTRSHLFVGDEMLLHRDHPGQDDEAAFPFRTGCTIPLIVERLKLGDRVSIDDGKLRGSIVRKTAAGWVVRFDDGRGKGVRLAAGKGLNFPDVDLGLDPLTAEDLAALGFITGHADAIGLSFVETAAHVQRVQDAIATHRPDWSRVCLVAKIETPRAVRNLPEIIVQAAGRQPLAVMIARGDLAVEMGFERLAEIQEEILWLSEAAHVPAIWATQVLEDLVKNGLPSRGEMTDAVMAGRAECVMLNKGPHVLAGVDLLDRLLRRMGEHQFKKTPTLRALKSWPR